MRTLGPMAGLGCALWVLAGCGPEEAPKLPVELMKTYPSPKIYANPQDYYARLHSLPDATLVTLFCRIDPKLEQRIVGGLDVRIVGAVLGTLEERYGEKVNQSLPPEQWHRLRTAMRRYVSDGRHLGGEPLWLFAARYDGDYVMDLLEDNEEFRTYDLGRTVRCLAVAGNQQRAWEMLQRYVTWMPELRLCGLIDALGDEDMTVAADFIYGKTHDLRWLVRLSALHALVQMDDPRADAALERRLADIRRSGPGLLSVIFLDYLPRKMGSTYMRQELAKALAERKIPGASRTLEAIANNAWEGRSAARISAGQALLELAPERGIAVVRRRLTDRRPTEQRVGIRMAQPHVKLLSEELDRVRKESSDADVRDLAAQVLD